LNFFAAISDAFGTWADIILERLQTSFRTIQTRRLESLSTGPIQALPRCNRVDPPLRALYHPDWDSSPHVDHARELKFIFGARNELSKSTEIAAF
jgi:hypothetical protein